MPSIDAKRLVDAVVTDLEAKVTLPEHRILKYVEPRGLSEDLAPALAVYPASFTYQTTLTSHAEVHGIALTVAWHEKAAYGALTNGVGDPELAERALARATDIGDVLATYVGGVTGYKAALLSVTRASLGIESGLVWTAEWTCQVSAF